MIKDLLLHITKYMMWIYLILIEKIKCQLEYCLLNNLKVITTIIINQNSILKTESIIKIKMLGNQNNIIHNIKSICLLEWKLHNMRNRIMNLAAKIQNKEEVKVQIFELVWKKKIKRLSKKLESQECAIEAEQVEEAEQAMGIMKKIILKLFLQ